MIVLRHLFRCITLLGWIVAINALAATATPPQKATYAVVGYYRNAAPAVELVAKAMQDVGRKMQDYTLVQDPDIADRVIDVLFQQNSYELMFNALSPAAMKHKLDNLESNFRVQEMIAAAAGVENTGGHGRGK